MTSEAKNKKWLGYTLYVVLVAAILLYFLFPGQAVDEFLDNSLSRISPEFSFRSEKIEAWIPPGLRITSGEVYLNNMVESAVFKSDILFVGPRILEMVKGERSFNLNGTAYSGELSGTFDFAGTDKDIFKGEISFRDFDLAEYDFLSEKFKHRLIGSFSGEIEYGKETAGAVGGSGKANLRLSDGQLKFKDPVFNIAFVDLQSIRLEAELGRRSITIVKAELAGPEVNGTMTGSIQLQKDIGLSQLNLKGSLEPLAEFYKNHPEVRELIKAMKMRVKRGQFSFTITGTLGDPKFKLL
jgi:type II secretion system protein N